MTEEDVSETIDTAHQRNEEKAQDPGASTGQGNEPEHEGYQPPESGSEGSAESEIPVGVDALTDEQIAKAEEAGPAAGGDDDSGALDVAELMEDDGGGDAPADDAPTEEGA